MDSIWKSRRATRLNYCIAIQVSRALNRKLAGSVSNVHDPAMFPTTRKIWISWSPGSPFGFMHQLANVLLYLSMYDEVTHETVLVITNVLFKKETADI